MVASWRAGTDRGHGSIRAGENIIREHAGRSWARQCSSVVATVPGIRLLPLSYVPAEPVVLMSNEKGINRSRLIRGKIKHSAI